MSKARTLANFVSAGNPLADGAIAASEVTGLATVATSGSYADLSNTPTTIGTANDLSGGAIGSIPYQAGTGDTAMLAAGTAGKVLTSNGAAAPSWETAASSSYRSVLNQSSDITLTTADGGGFINVSGTLDLNLNLPAANALTNRTIYIKNVGSYAMFVFDNAGTYLFTMSANSASAVWASDNSTAAGEWTIQELPYSYEGNKLDFGSTSIPAVFSFQSVGKLSTTTQIIGFYQTVGTTNKIYACIVTNTSGTLTFGEPQLISNDDGGQVSVVGLSSTSAIVSWRQNSSSKWRACAVSISGDTITAGTEITVASTIEGNIRFSFLTSTKAIGAAYDTTSNISGSIFTVSGTTLTASTPVGLIDTDTVVSSKSYGLGSFSATVGIIFYKPTGSGAARARSLSISGTTITVNALVDFAVLTDNGYVSLAISGSTGATAVYQDSPNASLKIRGITLSGTTLSLGSEQQVDGQNSSVYLNAVVHQTATTGYVLYHNSNSTGQDKIVGFTKSGTTFTIGTAITPNTTLTSSTSYPRSLTDFSAPAVGAPSATYTLYCNGWIGINVQLLTLSGTTASAATPRYVVNRMIGISAEDPYQVASISSTRAVVLTREYTDNLNVKLNANLISYSSNTPTLVYKLLVSSSLSSGSYLSITALTTTKLLLSYVTATTGYLYSVIVDVSGDTLSVGTAVLVNAGSINYTPSTSRISDTSALIHYVGGSSNSSKVNVLTVSGSTITVGTQYTIETSDAGYTNCVALSSTQALLFYYRSGNKVCLLTMSGSTITNIGTPQAALSGSSGYCNIVPLSSTKVIISGGDAYSARTYARVIDVVDGVLTAYTEFETIEEGYAIKFVPLTATQGIAYSLGQTSLWNYKIVNNNIVIDKQISTNSYWIQPLQVNSLTPSASAGATLGLNYVTLFTSKVLGFGAIK